MGSNFYTLRSKNFARFARIFKHLLKKSYQKIRVRFLCGEGGTSRQCLWACGKSPYWNGLKMEEKIYSKPSLPESRDSSYGPFAAGLRWFDGDDAVAQDFIVRIAVKLRMTFLTSELHDHRGVDRGLRGL